MKNSIIFSLFFTAFCLFSCQNDAKKTSANTNAAESATANDGVITDGSEKSATEALVQKAKTLETGLKSLSESGQALAVQLKAVPDKAKKAHSEEYAFIQEAINVLAEKAPVVTEELKQIYQPSEVAGSSDKVKLIEQTTATLAEYEKMLNEAKAKLQKMN
jgi:hypothetical protein